MCRLGQAEGDLLACQVHARQSLRAYRRSLLDAGTRLFFVFCQGRIRKDGGAKEASNDGDQKHEIRRETHTLSMMMTELT